MAIEQTLREEWHSLASTQASNETELLTLENVRGLGIGYKFTNGQRTNQPSLLAFVNQKINVESGLLANKDKIPPDIDGVPTDVLGVGEVFAGGNGAGIDIGGIVGKPQKLRERRRPAMGGDSVGHFQFCAGTIGTCCYDETAFPGIPLRYYILSSNHVLANSNNATNGDLILHPARLDGGTAPEDVIAQLSRFVPIKFISGGQAPCNFVDAAIAQAEFFDLSREIRWIGHVQGINASPNVGDLVQKTGRTTNFTTGTIIALNVTFDINYDGGRVARFCRQILTSNMSDGGDSGSLIVDFSRRAVGLFFAHSSVINLVNPITFVQSLLAIRITE